MSNPKSQTYVILGCSFLVIANAIINYKNGYMRLIFRDMTREENIFNLGKKPRDVENQAFEVNLIKNFMSEHN